MCCSQLNVLLKREQSLAIPSPPLPIMTQVALFLTAPNTLDPSLALGLYVKCGTSEWLYRGCVHSGHPSEVMPLQVGAKGEEQLASPPSDLSRPPVCSSPSLYRSQQEKTTPTALHPSLMLFLCLCSGLRKKVGLLCPPRLATSS